MRSNMKWLYVFSCLLAVALTTKTAAASGVLNDSEEPGSVLVFPLFETGITPGGITPRTQFEISVRCPNGAICTEFQDVDLRAHWVCPGAIFGLVPCGESDFNLSTTVDGTIKFDPQGVCEPTNNTSTNNFDTCGSIPPPPCPEGYLVAWVIDTAGNPIKFDGLIGDAVLRESATAVTAYNAVPIQAGGALANLAKTDVNGNGKLNFNGVEYKALTNKIIGSVHYDGLDPATGITSETSLILLTLDVHSGLPNNTVFVGLDFWNELEQLRSAHTNFNCFAEVFVGNGPNFFTPGLGETNTFGFKGLVESTSAFKIPVLGTFDHTGPVTLLGLVLTREDSTVEGLATRHYAYPLFDNSIPLATSFMP
jgi:hypothetical protein